MLDAGLKIASPFPSNVAKADNDSDWGRLTSQIAAGDRDAFSIYYQHFFDLMFREATRVTDGDEASCLDIVQDSMVKIIRTMRRIDDEKHLAAWSRAVVRNSAYDYLRKKQREQRVLHNLENEVVESIDGQELETAARIAWLEQQLLDQPADIQKLFSLRYRLGWTLKKIAAILGMNTGAVDGKIRRTLEKIKAKASLEDAD